MSRFNVTAAAVTRFREMIAKDKQGRDVIVLRLEEPKINNLRGSSGDTQWVRESHGRLLFDLSTERELAGQGPGVQVINGLKFFVVERASDSTLNGRTVDHTPDGFSVE